MDGFEPNHDAQRGQGQSSLAEANLRTLRERVKGTQASLTSGFASLALLLCTYCSTATSRRLVIASRKSVVARSKHAVSRSEIIGLNSLAKHL